MLLKTMDIGRLDTSKPEGIANKFAAEKVDYKIHSVWWQLNLRGCQNEMSVCIESLVSIRRTQFGLA